MFLLAFHLLHFYYQHARIVHLKRPDGRFVRTVFKTSPCASYPDSEGRRKTEAVPDSRCGAVAHNHAAPGKRAVSATCGRENVTRSLRWSPYRFDSALKRETTNSLEHLSYEAKIKSRWRTLSQYGCSFENAYVSVFPQRAVTTNGCYGLAPYGTPPCIAGCVADDMKTLDSVRR